MEIKMELSGAIKFIDDSMPNKLEGLPDEVFYFISRTTPLINVGLLIQDGKERTLLTWRDDEYCGKGWYIPGGIIRYKESIADRIKKVALQEIGHEVHYERTPLAVNELILPSYENRAHFISLLFQCSITTDFKPQNQGRQPCDVGYAAWHDMCPENLIKVHDIYRKYMRGGGKQ